MEEYIEGVGFECINNTKRSVKVSIWCITYNHSKYIEDALNGFLNQKVNFEYEIIVVDDASTDGTSDIIRKYAFKYSHIISAFIAKKNIYNKKNRLEIIKSLAKKAFNGKYVAFCEGDDFWIDRNKLQLQYDIMEGHREYSLVTHDFLILDYYKMNLYSNNDYNDNIVDTDKVIKQYPLLHTSTFFFKTKDYCMDDIFCFPGVGDYKRKVYLASKGIVYYIDRIMSVYRMNTDGSWSNRRNTDYGFLLQDCIRQICFLKLYDDYTKRQFHLSIWELIQTYARMMINDPIAPDIDKVKEELQKIEVDYPNQDEVIDEAMRYCDINKGIITDGKWNNYKYIVVWGTGNYSNRLTDILEENGNYITAYAVSDNSNTSMFRGRKIYSLEEIPFKEYTLVLVGIVRLEICEMLDILKKNGIVNYKFPFLFFDENL